MRLHSHPGEMLKVLVFEPLNMSVTEAARRLAITRGNLSRILNGKAGISPDLAIKLEMAGISTAEFWNNVQAAYELSKARLHKQPRILPLEDPEKRAERLKAIEDAEKAAA